MPQFTGRPSIPTSTRNSLVSRSTSLPRRTTLPAYCCRGSDRYTTLAGCPGASVDMADSSTHAEIQSLGSIPRQKRSRRGVRDHLPLLCPGEQSLHRKGWQYECQPTEPVENGAFRGLSTCWRTRLGNGCRRPSQLSLGYSEIFGDVLSICS